MNWTTEMPTEEGVYAFQKFGEWPIQICYVKKGNWRLAQDPDSLYGNDKPLNVLRGKWFLIPSLETVQ